MRLTTKELNNIEARKPEDFDAAGWELQQRIDRHRLLKNNWALRLVIGDLLNVLQGIELEPSEMETAKKAREHLRGKVSHGATRLISAHAPSAPAAGARDCPNCNRQMMFVQMCPSCEGEGE